MIRITRQGKTHVTLQGHARSDVYGKDLVCAAVSTLVLTLEANLDRLHRKGQLRSVRMHLEPGNARLRCIPAKEHRASVTEVFDSICLGFQVLSGNYPECVCYQESVSGETVILGGAIQNRGSSTDSVL